jgi:hypothetical protein
MFVCSAPAPVVRLLQHLVERAEQAAVVAEKEWPLLQLHQETAAVLLLVVAVEVWLLLPLKPAWMPVLLLACPCHPLLLLLLLALLLLLLLGLCRLGPQRVAARPCCAQRSTACGGSGCPVEKSTRQYSGANQFCSQQPACNIHVLRVFMGDIIELSLCGAALNTTTKMQTALARLSQYHHFEESKTHRSISTPRHTTPHHAAQPSQKSGLCAPTPHPPPPCWHKSVLKRFTLAGSVFFAVTTSCEQPHTLLWHSKA